MMHRPGQQLRLFHRFSHSLFLAVGHDMDAVHAFDLAHLLDDLYADTLALVSFW